MDQYTPLNLYTNYEQAALNYPSQQLILDEVLPAFPELPLETTYAESLAIIQQRAYQLARCGVQARDKVVIFKSPKFDTYLLATAVSYLGAIPVMVSYHFPVETMTVFVERLEDPFILFDDQTANVVQAIENSSDNKHLAVSYLLQQTPLEAPQLQLELDEISYMTHTSGTTGIPKLICHSANSMGWRTLWQRTIFEKITEKKLLAFHISPVHSRFNIGMTSAMAMGFPLMPLNTADSQKVGVMLTRYQPIALETHPNNFVQWSFYAKEHPEAFHSIRYYHSTFDAINNQTMARFLEASGDEEAVFLQVYGQSECGPMILKKHTLVSLKGNDARDMGIGLEGLTQARIADKNGNVLPANTDGHIQFLSKGRALTYYKEDARFQETVYNEWWDSGDYGMIDYQGHLFLKDRQVDLIEKINSNLAIEDYLLDHLDFLEEVVIVRDQDQQPQPIISVVTGKEMNWDAWWEKIADLPHLNEPLLRKFEEIPRTATMKVQRLQIEQALKNHTF
ncbi:AMP-binding protein [Enterococcus sp. DIV2402]|uniref:AMP-binding protein n=1 Tax=Candidatus Enterococcus lowellii TaxID=2230877 RepID=A0ABZ2SJW7_9ENTE|nr:acyl-CoA synthetase [Enterococcus sp. DIV2402]MBO0465123.1 acyl-CoA synthetase [Enterococcus sp. DIV2402]